MKTQTILNMSVANIIRQGGGSLDSNGHASYREDPENGTGTRCAVGYFITDRSYNPCIEGEANETEAVRGVLKSSGFTFGEGQQELLVRLQSDHDNAFTGTDSKSPIQKMRLWAEFMIETCNLESLIVPKQLRELAEPYSTFPNS